MEIQFSPIGTIHSPFHDLSDMPIQPSSDSSAPGTVELLPEFTPGLTDLEGFSHILLIYYLHRSHHYSLAITPFLDEKPHGILCHSCTEPAQSDWTFGSEANQGGGKYTPCGLPRYLRWHSIARY